MTIRTDSRLRSFEKLRAMTTDAGSMTGKVRDVGILSNFLPIVGGDLVARVTGRLVLFCCMRKM